MLIKIFTNMLITFAPEFGDLSLKNESRNANIDPLIQWSILRMFNEAEPP